VSPSIDPFFFKWTASRARPIIPSGPPVSPRTIIPRGGPRIPIEPRGIVPRQPPIVPRQPPSPIAPIQRPEPPTDLDL
jgi:hypothetical protein